MSFAHVDDLQGLNFALLMLIREGLAKDRDGTRHRFQLTVDLANRIQAMDFAEVQALSSACSDLSLFIPRPNMLHLLAVPHGLVPLLASARFVRQPHSVARTPGRRRSDYVQRPREVA